MKRAYGQSQAIVEGGQAAGQRTRRLEREHMTRVFGRDDDWRPPAMLRLVVPHWRRD